MLGDMMSKDIMSTSKENVQIAVDLPRLSLVEQAMIELEWGSVGKVRARDIEAKAIHTNASIVAHVPIRTYSRCTGPNVDFDIIARIRIHHKTDISVAAGHIYLGHDLLRSTMYSEESYPSEG